MGDDAQLRLPGTSRARPVVHRRERSAELVLARWRAAGHEVDEVTSSALRAAARAVDLAESDHSSGDASALTVSRAVAVWWTVYRDASPAGADEHGLDLDDLDEPLDLDA